MKRKSVTALLAVMATSLMFSGCGSTPTSSTNGNSQTTGNQINSELKQETLDRIAGNEPVEIEIAVPQDEEDGTVQQLSWTQLSRLGTYLETLRNPIDNYLGNKWDGSYKVGMLYESNEGVLRQNNTLKGALQNSRFRESIDTPETITAFSDAALNTYTDLEEGNEYTNAMMAVNGYFNLLPDTEEGYCNADSTLTRSEFMSLVMRAETPVDESLRVDATFSEAVGESEYNLYAQSLAEDSYLNLSDKSLNNQTYNGTISRAEAVYMLMNHYYAEDLEAMDLSTIDTVFEDAKDGGDIATAQGYNDKDYGKSYEMVYAINNPDGGLPTDLYKALVLAEQKGVIDLETRWDEGLTKSESIELTINTLKTLPIASLIDPETGEIDISKLEFGERYKDPVTGAYHVGQYDHGHTSQSEYDKDAEDGIVGGTIMYNEDNTTYIVWNDGRIFEPGDKLPNGVVWGGTTPEDEAKAAAKQDERLEKILEELKQTED